MKAILVGTDFSPAATNAANYATDMALAINADLYILHVYELPISFGEIPVSVVPDDLKNQAEKDMKILVDDLTRRSNGRIKIETEISLGTFFDELKMVCEHIKPYAVVMGSKGKTAAERILFGSHAIYTMNHLKWPLITVPVGVSFSSVKKIGLACDFQNVEETVPIDEIKEVVKDYDAELHILNTAKKESFSPELVFQSGILREKIKELNPIYHFITNKNKDDGILEFATKNNLDLIIVLPKRHSLLEKITHKSLTKQLILHSPFPVMALH